MVTRRTDRGEHYRRGVYEQVALVGLPTMTGSDLREWAHRRLLGVDALAKILDMRRAYPAAVLAGGSSLVLDRPAPPGVELVCREWDKDPVAACKKQFTAARLRRSIMMSPISVGETALLVGMSRGLMRETLAGNRRARRYEAMAITEVTALAQEIASGKR